jgi:flavin-dependent dehydrogenase
MIDSHLPASTDLFVIGGGPAGLAAAIVARQRGMDVTVAEHSTPPIDKACGEGIMPDGVAAARALGIHLETADVRAFRGIRFREGEVTVEAEFPAGTGFGMRRTALHQLMVRRAADCGVRLMWGARVTGITLRGVETEEGVVHARWTAGADGGDSAVRRWAGLDACARESRRYGFRRHYRVAPWTDFMELNWTDACQLYVTPVSDSEVCVALLSADPHLRLDDALPRFPEVQQRLRGAAPASLERGAVTASRRLRQVCQGNVALVGDASGSVDAITGEGVCLLFQHATALAAALEAGDLRLYRAAHRRAGQRPRMMASLMLLLDRQRALRGRALRAMASRPRLFRGMLAMHVGELSMLDFAANGLALGWRMLTL